MFRRTVAPLLVGIVLGYCVLSFYQPTASAQRRTGGQPPFANSVEQRIEMVNQLKEIKELLKEQNALLSSGKLTVVVSGPK